ncbi:MAG: hypothetical protein B7733_12855 [Myxococcales bacterium FL481]|nr:MAG: hypothetical protein B7733_12855 [Myxococcales bacterium FL481]
MVAGAKIAHSGGVHVLVARLGFALLVLTIGGLLSVVASAAEPDLPPPAGWVATAHADPAALVRANQWSERSNLELVSLLATEDRDDFIETAALLVGNSPLDPEQLQRPEAALAHLQPLMAKMIDHDDPPQQTSFVVVGSLSGFVADYVAGEVHYRVALMPAASRSALLLMAYKAADDSLYAPQFDGMVQSLEGLAAPIAPFPRRQWRWGTVLGWVLVAVVAFLLAVFSADRRGDYRGAGNRTVVTVGVLLPVAMGVVWWALAAHGSPVGSGDATPWSVAIEVGVVGAIVAAVQWALTRLLAHEIRIESAPQAGAFSGRHSLLGWDPASARDDSALTRGDLGESSVATRTRRPTLRWDGVPAPPPPVPARLSQPAANDGLGAASGLELDLPLDEGSTAGRTGTR